MNDEIEELEKRAGSFGNGKVGLKIKNILVLKKKIILKKTNFLKRR